MSIQLDQEIEMDSIDVGEEIRFISTIGTLGKERRIVNIPKKYHKQVDDLIDKEVVVIIREIKL
jgi:hypothetical protein